MRQSERCKRAGFPANFMPMPVLSAIYRYPVKGLSPEALDHVVLKRGETLPCDRAYAIENGTADFDPDAPRYFPKAKFLMLMRDEKLATLATRFEDDGHVLTIERAGKQVARGALSTPIGRKLIEQFFAAYMKDALRGPPRIVHAPGFSISDVPQKWISIINLASLRDIERVVGQPVDPQRFRANLYVDGLPAWAEHEWIGQELICADATRLKVEERTSRCAAVNVNPQTAARDLQLPRTLMNAFGHADCGVYASVIDGGRLTVGEAINLP